MGNENITFDIFKSMIAGIVAKGGEPEYSFLLNGKQYMIIAFKNFVTFQRFGDKEEQSGEIYFKNIDELYNTETIDGIFLKRDWKRIENLGYYDFYEGET